MADESAEKLTQMSSIRLNVAVAQRPLASASKVASAGNRGVQNLTTGERMALRADRGVYFFDVIYKEGDSGAAALDSGASASG